MPMERAEIKLQEGKNEEFLGVFRETGAPILRSVPGVREVKFGLGVEDPQKFLILVDWESMDAHAKFPEFGRYSEFREMFTPYTAGASMEHFELE